MMSTKIAGLLKEASDKLEKYDLGSAMTLYRQALQLDADNGAAAMGLAMVLNRNGQPGEALPLLRRIWAAISLMQPKPTDEQTASVLAQMGLAQQQLGQVSDALASYRQAARLVSSEDLRRRIQQLEPLANSPVPVQQLILHARQLHQSRQLDEATRSYRAALQLQQDSAEALHGLAMTLRDQRAYDEALPLMQKATVLAPDRAEYFNDLGMLFQDKGDFNKAISFHKRALKLFPKLSWAYINIGVAHKRLGQLNEAAEAYVEALKINPDSAEAHNNLGNLYRMSGHLPQAAEHLKRAVAIRPNYEDAIANLLALKQQLDTMIEKQKIGESKPKNAKVKVPESKGKPATVAGRAKPSADKQPSKAMPVAVKPAGKVAPVKKATKPAKKKAIVEKSAPKRAGKKSTSKNTVTKKAAPKKAVAKKPAQKKPAPKKTALKKKAGKKK